MSQLSFLAVGQGKKRLKCERFLEEMSQVIPWQRLCALIEPYYVGRSGIGRRAKELELMLKVHCLQQWYQLSDPGMEEAIYDRNSFQKFLRLDLISEAVPDETTILHFRHLLERHDLSKRVFEEIRGYLVERGLLMKAGTIVDATLIAAPTSTKNETNARDSEMSSTKKGNEWYFGMKSHIGVDVHSALVHTMEATTAKVHDKAKLGDLQHGEEKSLFGDKGYYDEGLKRTHRASGLFWGILDRAKRGHGLSSSQQQRNRKLASVRAKVEHPFQVIKCQWKYVKTRYRGLRKNTGQLYMLFALYNLYRVRRQLLMA